MDELSSLVDTTQNPTLPLGHPFDNVRSYAYWTGTTTEKYAFEGGSAWYVRMDTGKVNWFLNLNKVHVWPVRGGHADYNIYDK